MEVVGGRNSQHGWEIKPISKYAVIIEANILIAREGIYKHLNRKVWETLRV